MDPNYDHWNNTNLDKYLSGKPSKTHDMMGDNSNHNLSASLDYDYPMMTGNVNSGNSYYPSTTSGTTGGGYFSSSNTYGDFNMSRQHSNDILDNNNILKPDDIFLYSSIKSISIVIIISNL